jgi:O-antigen/teichoic acid export membrane protein
MLNKLKIKLYSFFTEGHSRTILAKKNIAITFFFKAGNFIIGMLLVTITINYINPTQYGIWLTLSSLINWFNIFDIGLGNGLKNILAKTNALEQHINSQAYISTTYAILSLISIFIFLLFIFINPFINWSIILNSSNNVESLNLVVIFIVTFFCISFRKSLFCVRSYS